MPPEIGSRAKVAEPRSRIGSGQTKPRPALRRDIEKEGLRMRQQKRVLSTDSPKDEREDPIAEADEPSPPAKGIKRQTEVVILSRPPEPTERISWIPAAIGLAAVVTCSIATTVVIMSSQSASSSPTRSAGPSLAIPPTNARPASPPAAAAQATDQAGVEDAHDRFFPAALEKADMAWDEGDHANAQKQYAALVASFPSSMLPTRVRERAQGTP